MSLFRKFLEQGPGNGAALLLSAGEGDTPLAHHGLVPLGEVHDIVMDAGVFRRLL